MVTYRSKITSVKTTSNLALNEPFRYRSSSTVPFTTGMATLTNSSSVAGTTHNWPGSRGIGDAGGPVGIQHDVWTINSMQRHTQYAGVHVMYDGPLYAASCSAVGLPVAVGRNDSQLDQLGTTAIARTVPTNPSSSLSVALGEIYRDGFPRASVMTMSERTKKFKAIGDDYLNVEFGWRPFVSDVRALAHSVKDSKRILAAFQRGSERKIKRGMDFPSDPSISIMKDVTVNLGVGRGSPKGWASITKNQETWFKGCYRYHVAGGQNLLAKMDRWESKANHLLGTRLTPDVVWELAPWSWAVDWITNVGDVMNNISAFSNDSLVMQYGYIMEHTLSEVSFGASGLITDGNKNVPYSVSTTHKAEIKKRRQASPYGFGVSIDGFSARQWAILGALGLARSPGKLSR